MIRTVLTAAFFLSGCTGTYSGVKVKTPALEFDTEKTPSILSSCIAPKVLEIWKSGVSVLPDGENTLIVINTGITNQIITIAPTANGSHAIVRQAYAVPPTDGQYKRSNKAIESCK